MSRPPNRRPSRTLAQPRCCRVATAWRASTDTNSPPTSRSQATVNAAMTCGSRLSADLGCCRPTSQAARGCYTPCIALMGGLAGAQRRSDLPRQHGTRACACGRLHSLVVRVCSQTCSGAALQLVRQVSLPSQCEGAQEFEQEDAIVNQSDCDDGSLLAQSRARGNHRHARAGAVLYLGLAEDLPGR